MRVTIEGRSLHYEEWGAGEPVLFIHGFPLSGEMWRPTLEHLGKGWRAIVPDLPGLGASDPDPEPSMASFAAALAALLDALEEPRPAVLVGLSMGGYVAFEFCRRYPARVRALVLVDTRAQPDTADGARVREETAERVLREGSQVIADAMLDRLFAPSASAELRERWREVMAANPPVGVAAALRAMAKRPDSAPTLRSIARPILIVMGEDDRITPPEEGRRMQAEAPGARLEIVPGAGHLTPVEQPERFEAILRDFLSGLGARPPGVPE